MGSKINLGDETYVSGPKSYCTWLSVEIKHMDTGGSEFISLISLI